MKVVVKYDDNDYEYEIPFSKLLPFLKITQKQLEAAIQQAIRRV